MHTKSTQPHDGERTPASPLTHNTPQPEAPLDVLHTALHAHSLQATQRQLGNRSAYIGMSDVGHAVECLRSAVARKLSTSGPTNTPVLKRLLTLQRGHWQEQGIMEALSATGHTFIPQLEIAAAFHGVPIRAHLDLTLIRSNPHPCIQVWELKSNQRLPETLYTANEVQLYGQIGLLHACWNRPCFSVRDASGHIVFSRKTFPEAAYQLFQIDLPDSPEQTAVEGYVLSVAMSDAKAFGPYPPDRNMLGVCLRTAATLWQTMQTVATGSLSLDDVPTCQGFHPLCDWCDANGDCPKFKPVCQDGEPITLDDEYAEYLAQLTQLKERKRSLEGDIAEMEDTLRSAWHRLTSAASPQSPGWIAAGNYRFKTAAVPGRSTLDQTLLKEEVTKLTHDEQATEALLSRCRKTGAQHERLTISPINTKGA